MVTSSAQNDSGLFETNLHDERYLPFERVGAISEWSLELPDAFRPFDYDTISDVILHLRFTARDGGTELKEAAKGWLNDALNAIERVVERLRGRSGPRPVATRGTILLRITESQG